MTLISDIQYFATIILYKSLYNCSNIIFEQYETYQKMSFRNRCRIAGAQGVVELSVPLRLGRDQRSVIRDVRISDRQPWAAQHWKTIVSCYSRSPWFDHFRAELEGLYQRKWEFLLDWDLVCFELSLQAIGMARPMGLTTSWQRGYASQDVTDWRGKIKPKSGRREENGGAGLDFGDGSTARYRQVFEERTGFIPNLSILDLLFCEGPQAIRYIRSPSNE